MPPSLRVPLTGSVPRTSPPRDAAYAQSETATRFGVLAFAVVLLHLIVAVAIRADPVGLLVYNGYFLLPGLITMMILGGLPWRTRASVRILAALATAALVYGALYLGDPVAVNVEQYFLLFLPALGAFVVVGTGRFKWSWIQIAGGGLLVMAVWRPLYFSLPALTQVVTSTGTVPAEPTGELYREFIFRVFENVLLVMVGLFLFFRRFPFVQKEPQWPQDPEHVLRGVDSWVRRRWWLDLAAGPTVLVLALFGTYLLFLLFDLIRDSVPQGADDSAVFSLITPDLVFLLSLVAGIGEEIIYRSLLQPTFERGFRRVFPGSAHVALACAVGLQAFLFAVVHVGYSNLFHVVGPFGFGVLMGYTFRYFGLLPCIYAHVAVDIIAFGNDAAQYGGYTWMGWFVAAFAFLNLVVGIFVPAYALVQWWTERRRGQLAVPAE